MKFKKIKIKIPFDICSFENYFKLKLFENLSVLCYDLNAKVLFFKLELINLLPDKPMLFFYKFDVIY